MYCATLLKFKLIQKPFNEVCWIRVASKHFPAQQNLDEEEEAHCCGIMMYHVGALAHIIGIIILGIWKNVWSVERVVMQIIVTASGEIRRTFIIHCK